MTAEAQAPEVIPERMKKSALAREIGISRVTLDAYLNRAEPAPPRPDLEGKWSVEEVANYIAGIKGDESQKKGSQFWEAEKRRLQCEEIAQRLQVQAGKFISKAEAAKTIPPLMAELGTMLTQKFEDELPARYKGRDAVECAQMNRKAVDEIVSRFRNGMKSFTQ